MVTTHSHWFLLYINPNTQTPLIISKWTIIFLKTCNNEQVLQLCQICSQAVAIATEVGAKKWGITEFSAYSILHSSSIVPVKPLVAVRVLLGYLDPASVLVQLLPRLMHVFSWHLPQGTPSLQLLRHRQRIAITNQNTTAMISLGSIWSSGIYGFNNCSTHSQQSCLFLEYLMCCCIKIQVPGCSVSLVLEEKSASASGQYLGWNCGPFLMAYHLGKIWQLLLMAFAHNPSYFLNSFSPFCLVTKIVSLRATLLMSCG